jgi:hypothetical protein
MIVKIRGLEIIFSFLVYIVLVNNIHVNSVIARFIIFCTIYIVNLFIYTIAYNLTKGEWKIMKFNVNDKSRRRFIWLSGLYLMKSIGF